MRIVAAFAAAALVAGCGGPPAASGASQLFTLSPGDTDCFMQPNQYPGKDVVVEFQGPEAAAYCASLSAKWHRAAAPTFITSACTLYRADVGEAIVWDARRNSDGRDTCQALQATEGWLTTV